MTLSHAEIKRLKSLTVKKYRDASGLFTVEGAKLVEEALRSRFTVEQVVRRDEIGEEAMARITALSSPSPVLAVVRQPADLVLDDARIPSRGLFLALDAIRDPGNLGTILRIADWFGIRQILASDDTVELYNPKVVQATMGAIFRVRVHYCDLKSEVERVVFRDAMAVYGTFLEGDNIYEAPLTRGGIVVMGSEANGISPEVASVVTRKLFIPPFPPDAHTSESLNVAVAAAITCAEFRRRDARSNRR